MKKLTALLLGTVVGVAFTTGAFAADPLAGVKNYLMSDDGNTGVYIGLSYDQGDIDDVNADYTRNQSSFTATSTWQLKDGKGFHTAAGIDFGKIRFDWRVGAMHSQVETIDNAALENGTTNTAVFAYSTGNVAIDLYRWVLIGEDKAWNEAIPVIAITPYIEGGWGYGAGWMTGKKNSDAAGSDTKRDAAGHGSAWSYGGGVLINLTSAVGITLGYHHLNIRMDNELVTSELGEVGVRFTF